jgi:hypothetical protein
MVVTVSVVVLSSTDEVAMSMTPEEMLPGGFFRMMCLHHQIG